MDIQQRINLEVLERFRAEGIGFAFPTRTLVVRSEPAGDLASPAAFPAGSPAAGDAAAAG